MEHYVARKNIRQYNTNATFTRSSSAIVPTTGATVANNVTRIVNDGVLVEEGTTNLITSPYLDNNSDSVVGTSSITKMNFNVNGLAMTGLRFVQGLSADIVGFNVLVSTPSSSPLNLSFWMNSTKANPLKAVITVTVSSVNYWLTNSNTWTTTVTEKTNIFSAYSDIGNWQRVSLSIPAFPAGTVNGFIFGNFYRLTSDFVVDTANWQLEAKSYATTFAIGTRQRERLAIPISNLPSNNCTIEFEWTPTKPISGISSQTESPRILQIGDYYSNSSIVLWAFAESGVRATLYIKGASASGWSITPTFLPASPQWYYTNQKYKFALRIENGNKVSVFVDGVFYGPYTVPDGIGNWAGSSLFLGSGEDTSFGNAIYSQVRISNRARTNTEVLASYQNGLLPDDDTTFMLFPPTYYIQSKTDWNATDKINFTDFNRIESNTSIVRSFAEYLSYSVPSITTVTNRTNTYLEYLASINRIEQNIESIKANGFTPASYGGSETWTLGKGFDYDDANRLEGNLVKLLLDGEKVFLSYIYSGQVTTGHQRGDLPL